MKKSFLRNAIYIIVSTSFLAITACSGNEHAQYQKGEMPLNSCSDEVTGAGDTSL